MCRTPGAGGIDTFCTEPPASFTSSEANSFALATPLLPLLKEAFPRRGEKAPIAKYSEFQAKRGHPQRATSRGLPQPEYPSLQRAQLSIYPQQPPSHTQVGLPKAPCPQFLRFQPSAGSGQPRKVSPWSSPASHQLSVEPEPAQITLASPQCSSVRACLAATGCRKSAERFFGARRKARASWGCFCWIFHCFLCCLRQDCVCVCKWKVCSLAEVWLLCGGATNLLLSPPVVISLPLQAGHGAVPSPKGGAVPLDSCQRAAASSESCQLSLTFLQS